MTFTFLEKVLTKIPDIKTATKAIYENDPVVKSIYNYFKKQFPKNYSFYNLNMDELLDLGFRHFDDKLILIPFIFYPLLPIGDVFHCIDGTSYEIKEGYEKYIDNDYRSGLLSYGLKISETKKSS